MGKKVKKKTRNTHNELRVSSDSPETTLAQSNPLSESVDDGVLVVVETKPCTHVYKDANSEIVGSKIVSSVSIKCEDCREIALDRRSSKGRSKHGKKKGASSTDRKPASKCVWVCLECGHFGCGAVGLPTTPQSHALHHSKRMRHPCVIQFNNPNLRYCFRCNLLIPCEVSEENGEQKDVLGDIVKLIKGHSSEGVSMDIDDGGNVTKSENSDSLVSDGKGRYMVRGLMNLGNTCFFNSIMQNFLAADPLRDYFMKLDSAFGPLTMALKKLFSETSLKTDSRNGMSPKNLFGSICAKAPQFRGYQQQDSHELLRCLLDLLCTEELGSRKLLKAECCEVASSHSAPAMVDAIFGGQLSSTVCCVECGHASIVYEQFLDLSLPLPSKKSTSSKSVAVSKLKKKVLPPKRDTKRGRAVQIKGKQSDTPVLSHSAAGQSKNMESSSLVTPASLPVKEETMASVDDFSWLDFIGPDSAADGLDSVSETLDNSIVQDSDDKLVCETDLRQSSSESQSQVLPMNEEPTLELGSSAPVSCTDEVPLQAQGPEVILLPYKEESSFDEKPVINNEVAASSSVVDCEQDALEFDGLGDLFDEPDSDYVPSEGPWFAEKTFAENDVLDSGFLDGISIESDPDEVDNKDAPVSVNTCLAYFTKAELLLLNEHGWHCENCSKSLQGGLVDARDNQLKVALSGPINGDQLRSQSSPLNETLASTSEPTKSENCEHQVGAVSTSLSEGNIDSTSLSKENVDSSSINENLIAHSTRSGGSANQASIDDSSSANEMDGARSNKKKSKKKESKFSASGQDSDDSEEVDSKRLKVKRDATKQILINKLPTILNIHLKRFSHDARGRLNKLNGHVDFGETIDLRPYMDPRSVEKDNCHYRLIGVVEHSGTMRGGHYVAYVRGSKSTEEDNGAASTWFYASDAHVREVTLSEVLRSQAYILFYEKI